mgnify:CR=1 FL=1
MKFIAINGVPYPVDEVEQALAAANSSTQPSTTTSSSSTQFPQITINIADFVLLTGMLISLALFHYNPNLSVLIAEVTILMGIAFGSSFVW